MNFLSNKNIMARQKSTFSFTKGINLLIKTILIIPIMTVSLFPAFAPEMQLKSALFFQVRASYLHCKLEYGRYTLIDTRDFVDIPTVTTFGYGIDAENIFRINNNIITLVAEPVDTPKMPLAKDQYCEIRLYIGVKNGLEETAYILPFNLAFDDNEQPYSLDKAARDFPDPKTDPRNEISVNYHVNDPQKIKSITLQKHVDIQLY